MKITGIEPFVLKMGYKSAFRTSLLSESEATGILLRVTTADGECGWGYMNVFRFAGCTVAGALEILRDSIQPVVVGEDCQNLNEIIRRLDRTLPHSPHYKAGVELGLWDLKAKRMGVPLHVLFGTSRAPPLPTLKMVSMGKAEEMAAEAKWLVAQGFRALKLKIGTDPSLDIDRVAAVRNAVGKNVFLTIDANGAYTAKQAMQVSKVVEPLGVAIFEQPTAPRDFKGLRWVREMSSLVVEADQSASTLDGVLTVIENQAADSINLKVGNLGGLEQARCAANLCAAHGISFRFGWIPGDTGLVTAGAAHLATALGMNKFPHEFAEYDTLIPSPVIGLRVTPEGLILSGGPGLGIEISNFALQSRP